MDFNPCLYRISRVLHPDEYPTVSTPARSVELFQSIQRLIGNLEFQFQTGDLNLKSTSIDWLVISSENAQFKGQARVNGTEGYFFRVIAKDFGEPGVDTDEFDIKIWDGDPDDVDTSLVHNSKNVLGGGNIVVHKK